MFIKANNLFITKQNLNRIVFNHQNKQISMRDFMQDVANFAVFSKNLPEKVILFIKNDIYQFAVCFMGLLQAQKDVILPPFLKDGQLRYLKDVSNTLITTEDFEATDFNIVNIPEKLPKEEFQFSSMENRNVCFFTSGSTGIPKQIIKPFHTLSKEVENIFETQKSILDKAPVVLASVAPYHIYGMLWRLLFPLCCNLKCDTDYVFYPEELQQKQKTYKHVIFATTPSFMDKLIKYQDQYQFQKNCLAIFSSGSLLRPHTSEGIFHLFHVSPFEIFGSTETGGVAYRQQKDGPEFHVFNSVNIDTDEQNRIIVFSDFSVTKPYTMQDAIETIDNRTFLLKERLDRLVKIAEKRISLPEMEDRLMAHPWINQAYVFLYDDEKSSLAVVLSLTDEGKEFLKSHTKKQLVLLLNQYMEHFFEKVALPKRTRFVYELPTNEQGKLLKENLLSIVESRLSEPVIENLKFTSDGLTANLTFIPDSPYFDGHFPNFPILAGVVQVFFAKYFFRTLLKIDLSSFDLVKLKFAQLIQPSETVYLRLSKKSTGYSFSYTKNDKLCSMGTFSVKE